ncbi:MAG: TonB-dependent receptor domain-containing protein [Bacteroidales bacterium]
MNVLFLISAMLVFLPAASAISDTEAGSEDLPDEKGVLTGKVVESVSDQPVEYVNIALFPPGSEEMVTGGITNEKGIFRIENIAAGTYDIRLSFIGFQTSRLQGVSIGDEEPVKDLGTLRLDPTEEMMESVTVSADREMLLVNLDKTVFNVGRDMTSTGGSAVDIMETIPSVTVDYEGNVSLRGSGNVTILIDGRPSYFESLDQLPASMIDQIEVITNPSARHDPDGTSGIINVVMKKERQYGTNGMVSANMGTGSKYDGSVHVNQRIDRWNFFGNYNFRIHGMEGSNVTERERITGQGDTLQQLQQYEDFFRRGYFHTFRLGSDFFIDDKNTLTFSGAFNLRDTRPRNYSDVDLFLPASQQLNTEMERRFEGFGREYALNYTRKFDQEGREFLADVFYAASSGETVRDILVDTLGNPDGRQLQSVESSTPGKIITLQADYVHPWSDHSRFELGVKSIFRDLEDDFRFFDEDAEGSESLNPGYSNYFLFNEAIHSVYGIYAFTLGPIEIQTGLRAEQHDIDAEQRTTGEEFDRSLRNLFPSAHMRYFVAENHALFMNYSKRVNRPGISLLNPFVNYSDPMNVSYGNPGLKPEFIDSYETGYQYTKNRTAFTATLFYRETEDIISREMTLPTGDDMQSETTFENLQSSTSYGLETTMNYPLFPWWRLTGNYSYFYRELEDERLSDWDHGGDSWMVQASSDWNVTDRISAQARFNYRSEEVTAGRTSGGGCQQHGGQGIQDDMYFLDLGVKVNVLDGDGTISLRLNDVFQSRKFDMYTYGESFTADLARRPDTRVLYVGFTWRFNEYRQRSERDREGSILDEID